MVGSGAAIEVAAMRVIADRVYRYWLGQVERRRWVADAKLAARRWRSARQRPALAGNSKGIAGSPNSVKSETAQ